MTPEAIVTRFCATMVQRDAEALRDFLADDCVYQNVGHPPIRGVTAILENLAGQFSTHPDAYEYVLVTLAASGETVLTERLDMVRSTSGELKGVPVMGAFEVWGARIARWTDYWDATLATAMIRGDDVADLVPLHAQA